MDGSFDPTTLALREPTPLPPCPHGSSHFGGPATYGHTDPCPTRIRALAVARGLEELVAKIDKDPSQAHGWANLMGLRGDPDFHRAAYMTLTDRRAFRRCFCGERAKGQDLFCETHAAAADAAEEIARGEA